MERLMVNGLVDSTTSKEIRFDDIEAILLVLNRRFELRIEQKPPVKPVVKSRTGD
jgi:hypothetical protein